MAVIEPKGIIVHSMGEYLQWEGKWLTAHESARVQLPEVLSATST